MARGRKSDEDKFADFVKRVKQLAERGGKEQHAIALGVALKLRAGPLKKQYQTGEGPYGKWPLRSDGKPALVSRKLPGAIRFKYTDTGFKFVWRPDWMAAQHAGHVFPARKAKGREAYHDKNSRFIRSDVYRSRQLKASRKMEGLQALLAVASPRQAKNIERRISAAAVAGGFVVRIRDHAIGVRMLPPRPQYPTGGTFPAAWREAIIAGMRAGLREWRKSLKLGG